MTVIGFVKLLRQRTGLQTAATGVGLLAAAAVGLPMHAVNILAGAIIDDVASQVADLRQDMARLSLWMLVVAGVALVAGFLQVGTK